MGHSPSRYSTSYGPAHSSRSSNTMVHHREIGDPAFSRTAMAVCRITVQFSLVSSPSKLQSIYGSGFLGIYNGIHGLFTNYHVFAEGLNDTNTLHCTLHFKVEDNSKKRYRIDIKSCFCFACPLLDMMYVELNERAHKNIIEGEVFLDLDVQVQPTAGEKIYVLHRPVGSTCTRITKGNYAENFSFNYTHTASTYWGSSGSPCIKDLKREDIMYVIGMHKEVTNGDYKVGVLMRAVLDAIDTYYVHKSRVGIQLSFPKAEKCKPKVTTDIPDVMLVKHDVVIHECRCPSYKCGPAHFTLGQHSYETCIVLLPTLHGWYWTATDFVVNISDFVWMDITQSKIISQGKYHNYELKSEAMLKVLQQLSRREINILLD